MQTQIRLLLRSSLIRVYTVRLYICIFWTLYCFVISSPGRSPGRAIVLPLALASASGLALALANVKVFTLKFLMWWARLCQASYPVPVQVLFFYGQWHFILGVPIFRSLWYNWEFIRVVRIEKDGVEDCSRIAISYVSKKNKKKNNKKHTEEVQWLQHWWLVHGCFSLVLEFLGKKSIAADLR